MKGVLKQLESLLSDVAEQAEESFKRDPGMEDKFAPGQFLDM